jgi:hypothetical protein
VRTDRWGSIDDAASLDTFVPKTEDETTTNVSGNWGSASWSAEVDDSVQGPEGSKAACAEVQPGGALAYQGSDGDFDGKLVLDMWVDTSNGVPDVDTYIGGGGVRTCLCAQTCLYAYVRTINTLDVTKRHNVLGFHTQFTPQS